MKSIKVTVYRVREQNNHRLVIAEQEIRQNNGIYKYKHYTYTQLEKLLLFIYIFGVKGPNENFYVKY